MKKGLFTLLIGLLFTDLSSVVTAAPFDKNWYFGLHGGPVVNHESGADTRFGVGGRVGYRFGNRLDAGLYILTSQTEETSLGTTIELTDAFFGLEGNWHFWEKYPGLHAGMKFGALNHEIEGAVGTGSSVDIGTTAYGVEVGYEHLWNSGFSVGLDVNHLLASSGETTIGGNNNTKITVTADSTSYTNFLLSARYRF
jgi:hypothetical protein